MGSWREIAIALVHKQKGEEKTHAYAIACYRQLTRRLTAHTIRREGVRALVEPLGPRRRRLATAFLVLGLFSFFLPLIKLDTPVLNKTRWSPFDIAQKVYEGDLPPNALGRDLTDSMPIMIPTLYVLQLVALFSVAISKSPVTLKNIAVIGICTSWLWRGDRASFEQLFYGTFSYQNFSLVRRVGFGQHTFILLGVMGILWFVAANSDLDTA